MLHLKRVFTVAVSIVMHISLVNADTWTQTDWSGGPGQEYWSDSTRYWEGVNIDGTSLVGDLVITDATGSWKDGDPAWTQIDNSSNVLILGGNVRINIRTISYDFTDTVNNKAYEGYDTSKPPSSPPQYDTLFSGAKYDSVKASDDARASYFRSGSPIGQYEFHSFEFKVDEFISNISQLYVMHEGYGYNNGQYGLHLYIWNYGSSEWESVDYHLVDGDVVIDTTYRSGFSDYIGVDGYLRLLATTEYHAASCPFLYAWNGEQFGFIADFNTSGGLGYYDASAGRPYTPKPRDYVKIDGSQLKAVNGTYRLEIAEDQDEIVYLDAVKLLVVNHPQGTEIYTPTMTKFAEPYPFKIYTIREPILPISATDENGKDILPTISKVDRIYTEGKDFHWDPIIVDFGDLSNAEEIKMLYNAYIEWPLAPSIAARYMKEEYRVRVEVINENGKWEDVSIEEPLGLPQATPRTVVIDITDWFKTNDYRIRIHNYEKIRIDYIAVDTTENEEVVVTELSPVSADLHWKGVAKQFSPDGKRPYLANYYTTVDASGFEPFRGNFTKYGDVLPLLTDADDKFVIMHAGDDISLIFNEVLIPDEMERDYYLVSNAFYKLHFVRILLNEQVSRVEPLPFHGMSTYPYPENKSYPYDKEHEAYLRKYNTREFKLPRMKVAEHYTIYTDYTGVEVTVSKATLTSDIIAPTLLSTWDKFYASDSTRQDTTEITYSILNAENDSTLLDSVIDGQDISSITADSIKLNAIMISHDTAYSPVLCDWEVDWKYHAPSGTLTSSIYSVGVDSVGNWGTIAWDADVPEGTSITVETRTRNDPPDSIWSFWQTSTNGNLVPSPADKRHIQYRSTFTSPGDSTPTLHNISINHAPTSVGIVSSGPEMIPFSLSVFPVPVEGEVFIKYSVPGKE